MTPGDLVQITLHGVCKDKIAGVILEVSPAVPHIPSPSDPMQRPGPIFNLKILKTDGEIWDSWIDQYDTVEVLWCKKRA